MTLKCKACSRAQLSASPPQWLTDNMRWDDLRLCVPSDVLPADNAARDALLGRFVVNIPKQQGVCMAVQGNAHVQLDNLHQVAGVLLEQLVTYMEADAAVIAQLLGLTPQQLVKWQQHLQLMCAADEDDGADLTEASPCASGGLDSGVANTSDPEMEAPLVPLLAGLPLCELVEQEPATEQHSDGMQRRDDSRPDLVSFLIKDEQQTEQAVQEDGDGLEAAAARSSSQGQQEMVDEGVVEAGQPAAQLTSTGAQQACAPAPLPEQPVGTAALPAGNTVEGHVISAAASPRAQASSERERTTSPPDVEMQSSEGALQGIQLLAQAAVALESASAAACIAAAAAGSIKRKRGQAPASDGQGTAGDKKAAQDSYKDNHQPAAKRLAGLKTTKLRTSAALQLVGLLPPQSAATATGAGPSGAGQPAIAVDTHQAGVAAQHAVPQHAPSAPQPAGAGLPSRSRARSKAATPQPNMVQMSVGWVTIPFQLDPEVLVHVLAPSGSRVVIQPDGRQVVELPSKRQVQLPWATTQPQQPGQGQAVPSAGVSLPAGASLASGAQPTQKLGGRRHARNLLAAAAATPAAAPQRPTQLMAASQQPAAAPTAAAQTTPANPSTSAPWSPVAAPATSEPPTGTAASPLQPSTEDDKLAARQTSAPQTLPHPSALAALQDQPAEAPVESAADAAGMSPGTDVAAALGAHDLGCRVPKSREMAEYILLVVRQAGAGGFQLFDIRQAAALDNRDYHKRDMGNVLKQLVEKGRLLRIGRGGAGDPFRYFDPDAVAPAPSSAAHLAADGETGQDGPEELPQQIQVE